MTLDELAIQNILEKLEATWNAQDSVGFASLFAEDTSFIHIFGGQIDGRAAVQVSHRHIFDTIYKGSSVAYRLQSIRFVRPDVAILFTSAHLKYYEGEVRELDARPTFVLVKEQDEWQIVAFQNTKISEMPSAGQAATRLVNQ